MIPLVAPTITAKDRSHMYGAIRSGALVNDNELRRYEEAFAERVGCAGAVAVCSGTAALSLARQVTLRQQAATIPTYSCSALLNAMKFGGWTCGLVDSHFNVRTAQMHQERATVLVHGFGRGTVTNGYASIEDWTLSLGAGTLGNRIGLGVCSTHSSKMLSTGRGGVVFGVDSNLLDEVRALAYYDSTPNGTLGAHSLGMTSLQAALGLSQLRQLDSFIDRRREIAAAYSSRFNAAGIECPDPDCGSVFFRYLIGVEDPAGKVEALKQAGVEAGRGVYPPLHRQLGLSDDDFPGATACVNRLLSVPCHPSLRDADVAFVTEKVLEVCA